MLFYAMFFLLYYITTGSLVYCTPMRFFSVFLQYTNFAGLWFSQNGCKGTKKKPYGQRIMLKNGFEVSLTVAFALQNLGVIRRKEAEEEVEIGLPCGVAEHRLIDVDIVFNE